MLSIIDDVLKKLTFKSVDNIKKSHIDQRNVPNKKNLKEKIILLEGVNFSEVFKYGDVIDLNRIESNDIGSIMRIYGVSLITNFSNIFKIILRLKLVELLLLKKFHLFLKLIKYLLMLDI